MALIVQKFGGTSMGSLERIQHVASRVKRSYDEGHQIIVVVSAMCGETDRLIQLAKGINPHPDPREYDALISTGEQVSMTLLAMALISKGCLARSYNAQQVKIVTDKKHKKARIAKVEIEAIQHDLDKGNIVIVAGFQGVTENGDITTLGRGGSDTTAVAIAAAVQADECQIFTDVDGVYTADPRVVPNARHLPHITFQEMLELSSLGAKVLQFHSVECAAQNRVPLRVLSTFLEGPGTLITFEDPAKPLPPVSGIAYSRNESLITLRGLPAHTNTAAKILTPISRANIDVDMIVQTMDSHGLIDFTFTLERDEYPRAYAILSELMKDLGAKEILGNAKIVKLSLVGVGMRSNPGIASKMFAILGSSGINIQLISTSEIKISVLIDETSLEVGVQTLHAAFGLEHENGKYDLVEISN
ncbi:MAG: Aspartate kinase [Legionellaceae bacterium]